MFVALMIVMETNKKRDIINASLNGLYFFFFCKREHVMTWLLALRGNFIGVSSHSIHWNWRWRKIR